MRLLLCIFTFYAFSLVWGSNYAKHFIMIDSAWLPSLFDKDIRMSCSCNKVVTMLKFQNLYRYPERNTLYHFWYNRIENNLKKWRSIFQKQNKQKTTADYLLYFYTISSNIKMWYGMLKQTLIINLEMVSIVIVPNNEGVFVSVLWNANYCTLQTF